MLSHKSRQQNAVMLIKLYSEVLNVCECVFVFIACFKDSCSSFERKIIFEHAGGCWLEELEDVKDSEFSSFYFLIYLLNFLGSGSVETVR